MPELWKAVWAAASSFTGGIRVSPTSLAEEGWAWLSAPFPLHPSSAPSLCSPTFPWRSSLAFYSWGWRDHFCLHCKRVLNWLCIYIQDVGPQSCNMVIRNKRSVIFSFSFFFFSLFQAQRGAFSYFPCFPTDFHSQFMVCCGNDSRRGLLDLEVKA